MNSLEQAYELGRRKAVQEHIEKVAFIGALARGAGSLLSRGAQAGYSAAAPRVGAALTSQGAQQLRRQAGYLARDTLKSPMTYGFGALSAYSQEGSAWDKTKAFLTGGLIGQGSFKLMGGAHRAAFSRLAGKGSNKAFMKDLMGRGMSKKDAYAATMGRSRMINAGRSNQLKSFDRAKSQYKDAMKDLKFKDRLAIGLKYNKGQMIAGTAAFGTSGIAAMKGTDALMNYSGVGPQQENAKYRRMTARYPTPTPQRSSTISGNNNPYSR